MDHEFGWPFVRTTVIDDDVDSTSDRARELVLDGGPALPLLVWARSQSRGRGRGSRRWWSDRGSLTFTVAIDPQLYGLSLVHEPRIALATAVAIIDALGDLALAVPSIGIRWPNDLEAAGGKLGGILSEQIETERGRRLLIGIGLNVLSDLGGAPAEVRRMAVSLAELRDEPLSEELIPQFLTAILTRLESVLVQLASDDASLAKRWEQLDHLRDRWVTVDLGASIVAGWGRGIDAEGALCLEVDNRRTRLFGGQVLRL